MTVMDRARTTHSCMCGGVMIPQVGTITRVINGREIRIHNAPFFECITCGEREFDLSARISSLAVEAYRLGLNEIEWHS